MPQTLKINVLKKLMIKFLKLKTLSGMVDTICVFCRFRGPLQNTHWDQLATTFSQKVIQNKFFRKNLKLNLLEIF